MEDERFTVVQRLLWVLLAITVTAFVATLITAEGPPWRTVGFWVNLAAAPVVATALWLNHERRFEPAVGIVMLVLSLAGGAPVVLEGPLASDLGLLTLTLPIVLAGLVMGSRALTTATAWAIAIVMLGAAMHDASWGFAAQVAIVYLLVAYFLDRFSVVFRATLTDALEYQVRLKEQANDRLAAQEALLDEKRLTEAIIENLPGIFSLVRHDGKLSRWNRNLQRTLGYKPEELASLDPRKLAAPDDEEKLGELMRRVLARGVGSADVEMLSTDGRTAPYFVHASRFTLGGEDYVVGMGLDRTDVEAARSRIDTLSEELAERLERITALYEIDRAITGSLDLSLTLDVVLHQVIRRLRVDAAAVLLLDPTEDSLVFGASKGLKGRVLHGISLRLGEGHAGRAAVDRRRMVVRGATEIAAAFPEGSAVRAEGFETYIAAPLVAKGRLKGVLELFSHELLDVDEEWYDFLAALATQAAIALDNATLFESLERSNQELRLAYDRTIEGWARALDLRDEETEGHSRRVTDLTVRLGEALGMRSDDLVHARRGALLHDIGKMGVPDRILLKPGELDAAEWEVMKMHPTYAVELLAPIEFLRPAMDIPLSHHERWDGSGYPSGLAGESIPLVARIFAVVDVYDALTSDRPYRDAWSHDEAMAYVEQHSGSQFDPSVVEAFAELMEREALSSAAAPVAGDADERLRR